VYTLSKQCNKLNVNYQILCFDDGSEQKYKDLNHELAFKIHINYTEMPQNLGRSRIRNWLGKAAYFDYLLFLDGDSVVKSKDFIKKYIDQLDPSKIIYGGREYSSKKPRATKKILHWKYGIERESKKANARKKDPYLHFQSNNFIIPQNIFNKFPFDEEIQGYGYEDLLYASQLKKDGIGINHIDNPIIHDGLEIHTVFIKKTENALNNLAFLYSRDANFTTTLIQMYRRLEKYGFLPFFENIYKKISTSISKNMYSQNPSIFLFNLWKLFYFIQKMKEQ